MRKDNISLISSLQNLEYPLCKFTVDCVLVHSTCAQGLSTPRSLDLAIMPDPHLGLEPNMTIRPKALGPSVATKLK